MRKEQRFRSGPTGTCCFLSTASTRVGQCLREGAGVKAWGSLLRASQPWGDLGRKQGHTVSERG